MSSDKLRFFNNLSKPFVKIVENFYPDAFIFVILLSVLTFLLALVNTDSSVLETFEAWEFAIKNTNSPTALILSRQNLPLIRNDFKENKLNRGAYFLRQFNDGKFSIISTGSEVSLALKVHDFFVSKKIGQKRSLRNSVSQNI